MRRLPFLLLLALGACAHGPPAKTAATVWFPGNERQISEQNEDLFGSELQLTWAGDAWRGTAFGQLVELNAEDGHLRGNFGAQPADMTVEVKDDETRVRGLFRTELADLRISGKAIEGKVGRCSYDVRSEDGVHYSGFRSCRGPTEPSRVSLESFTPHPVGLNRVAPLVILLSQ